MIGKTISHYKITEKLGDGGMGVVYKATDTRLKRTVALKFLAADRTRDEETKKRFIHEARAASSLQHKNICTIHEIDETTDGQTFICMDCYEGETLKEKIERGPLKIEEALDLINQIAQGLACAHENQEIHRDIKPANIIITEKGDVKIVDFGLARLTGQTKITKEGTVLGTAAYMSPEQMQAAEVDKRSDIWSLGVVIYEMISGQQPFKGEYDQAVMYSILNEDPQPVTGLRTGVPKSLEDIINKTLEKEADLRYQSIEDLLADLKRLTKNKELNDNNLKDKGRKNNKLKNRKIMLIPSSAVIILALLFVLFQPFFEEQPLISSPKPLLVMPFQNQTGDKNLDYMKAAIPNLLITNLEQSSYLSVITWERMQDLLKTKGKNNIELTDIKKELGFELCQMDGIQAIVLGSFTKAGNVYATDIKVLDVNSKKLLVSANTKGHGPGSIIDHQIDELSKQIYRVVYVSFDDSSEEELKIKDVTTNSLEAYRYYLEGVKLYHQWLVFDARNNLQKALEIDSTFAMAWFYMARTQRKMKNLSNAMAGIRKAMLYSNNTTLKEALFIKMDYSRNIEQDFEKDISINEELVRLFPKEKLAHYYLGIKYRTIGSYNEAISHYKQAVELDPKWDAVFIALGYDYTMLGNYKEAREAFEEAVGLTPEKPNAYDSLSELFLITGELDEAILFSKKALEKNPLWDGGYIKLGYVYALKENYSRSFQQYEIHESKDREASSLISGERPKALIHFLLGRYHSALAIVKKQIALATQMGDPFLRAQAHQFNAFILAEMGKFKEAEKELNTSFKIYMRYSAYDSLRLKIAHQCISGFFNLKSGNKKSAITKISYVKENIPDLRYFSKEIYLNWTDLLEAEVLLAQGKYDMAVEKFISVRFPDPYYYTIWPYPHLDTQFIIRDGLARAYNLKGDQDKAIVEYRRLTAFDANTKDRFLKHPRYHYRLGKLYQEKGWQGMAIQQYEIFLDFWKDADQDLADLLDARERLAKLRTMSIN